MSIKRKQNPNNSLSRRNVLKCGLYAGLSVTLPSSLWLSGCRKKQQRKAPNVILISIDTARSDHCSACGYRRDTTPNLRAFAKQGTSFTTAYAPSAATGPSHATMLTALYPMEHRVVKNGLKLSQEYDTLAECLSAHGYQTAAVVSSFVLDSKFGYAQGFSFFEDNIEPEASSTTKETWKGHKLESGFDQRANYTTPKAINWLKNQRDPAQTFFLFLHYWDPHWPYDPPEPFSSKFTQGKQWGSLNRTIARYDAEIAFADYEISKLLTVLKRMKLEKDTLIVITSDHGEGLMQHGHMGHGIHLYEEAVRVPLIFRWPKHIPKNRTITAPVGLISLTPTILDLVGIYPGDGPLQRQSLAAAIRGQTTLDPAQPVYLYRSHYEGSNIGRFWVEGEKFGVRIGKWKYIEGKEENTKELFDLTTDPTERKNLYPATPKLTAQLASLLQEWKQAHTKTDAMPGKIAEEDLAPLKALGYVQ
ncbi:MAG: sulfatase [Planctomycetota bacterium]|nr:MAG: sulfatase [Planctomycetota bacterium]